MSFCAHCGTQIGTGVKFCSECGAAAPAPAPAVAPAPAPAATPAPAAAPPKGKFKHIIIILLVLAMAIIAGIAGIAGYLYLHPEIIKSKVESYIQNEVFLPTTATVAPNTTSLYADQSAKSTVLKTLKKDEVIIVTGMPANGWAPVKSGDVSGWVLLSSITIKK